MHRAIFLALLSLAACGAEVKETPTSTPSPGSSSSSPDTTPRETTETDPVTNEKPAPPAPPLVRLKNTSSAPRWVVLDAQSTPVDFEIGQPPLQLNGYGSYWCGGPEDNHNDPAAYAARIEGGEVSKTIHWRAISVTRQGDCWKGTPLAAGEYPTKACFYESEPTDIQVPWEKSKTVPLTCTDVTLTITAANETVLSF